MEGKLTNIEQTNQSIYKWKTALNGKMHGRLAHHSSP